MPRIPHPDQRRRTRYGYRRDWNYEAAYDVVLRGVTIGGVDRNGPSDWIAELHDGHRGTGRTRDAAVDAALTAQHRTRTMETDQ